MSFQRDQVFEKREIELHQAPSQPVDLVFNSWFFRFDTHDQNCSLLWLNWELSIVGDVKNNLPSIIHFISSDCHRGNGYIPRHNAQYVTQSRKEPPWGITDTQIYHLVWSLGMFSFFLWPPPLVAFLQS